MAKKAKKAGLICLLAVICTISFYHFRKTPYQAYRVSTITEEACRNLALDENANEVGSAPEIGCMLETHLLPVSGWVERGLREERYRRFDLAFVEMLEGDQTFGDGQVSALKKRLSDQGQKVVLLYVHGWRHNTSWNNGNVRKFRVMLAYMRSFLNSRCVANGSYCDAELVGVYAGWRGASLQESKSPRLLFGSKFLAAAAMPTLFSRKAESERLGIGEESAIAQLFEVLNSSLSLNANSQQADKLMIVGHSLGGNMLISHLSGKAESAVKNHEYGDTLAPIMGDLVVLLNPAAEAAKWTPIQKAERLMVGFENHYQSPVFFTDAKSNHGRAAIQWRHLYPETQRPVMLSITGTQNWNLVEDIDGDPNFDSATGVAFKAYALLRFAFSKENRTTIGHLLPMYAQSGNERTRSRRLEAGSLALGASHDFLINSGSCSNGVDCEINGKTSFTNAINPKTAWCAPNIGGLINARHRMLVENKERPNDKGFANNWDWRPNVGKPENSAEIQFRHQLALANPDRFVSSMASPNTPFWNVRAADTGIAEHDGIYSYPLWCGLTQIWLDPVSVHQ